MANREEDTAAGQEKSLKTLFWILFISILPDSHPRAESLLDVDRISAILAQDFGFAFVDEVMVMAGRTVYGDVMIGVKMPLGYFIEGK